MTDNSEPAQPRKKKCVKFNESHCNSFKFTQKSLKEGFASCIVCRSDFSIARGTENDINTHKVTSKHKRYVDAVQRQRKLTDFGASSTTAKLDQNVVKAELLFYGFLTKQNLPLSAADYADELFWNIRTNTYAVARIQHIC